MEGIEERRKTLERAGSARTQLSGMYRQDLIVDTPMRGFVQNFFKRLSPLQTSPPFKTFPKRNRSAIPRNGMALLFLKKPLAREAFSRRVGAPKNRCFYRQDLDVYTPILKSVQSIVSASSLSRPYLCVSSLSMLRFAPPHYRYAVNARPPEIPPHFVRCCFAVRFRFAPLRMTRAGGQCPLPKIAICTGKIWMCIPRF